ncbi:MAG: cytochrome-c peroxidase [Chloroflexi bacterium]|nr:cytochrome-c peroxidase [Chloroflexota bacterium]
MKRKPLLYTILFIELMVGLVLLYNFNYLVSAFKPKPLVTPEGVALSVEPTRPSIAVAQTQQAITQSLAAGDLSPAVLSVFAPLPAVANLPDQPLTDAMVNLGRMLFYEPRLSATQDMSCNTCHLLAQYGTDQLPVSIGHVGRPVTRNSPTVYNAAFQIAQFWDGRSPTVEEQAKVPILASGEMGMETLENVEVVLRSIPGYAQPFAEAFPVFEWRSYPVNR